MNDPLGGKSALVTGAGRGIGRAVALQLAGAGANVALVARSRDELTGTADLIKEIGGTALTVPADLGSRSEVMRVAETVTDGLGATEILVNNAAVVWPLGPSVRVDPADWAAAIEINLIAVAAGPLHCSRRCSSAAGGGSPTFPAGLSLIPER